MEAGELKRIRTLLEDQLGELVQAVFPDDEVVLALRVFDERAGDAVLVAEGLEAGAVVHQIVLAAADHPEELVLLLYLLYIGNELGSTHGVGRRRETTDIGKDIHVAKSEVERLSTTH